MQILRQAKYDPDSIMKWKQKIQKEFCYQIDSQSNVGTGGDDDEEATQDESKKDFDYILSMPISNLTMEKKDEILKQQKQKGDELKLLRG